MTWEVEAKPHVRPVSLQDFLGDRTQAPSGPSPPQEDDWALQFDRGRAKAPTLSDIRVT